jgi:ATP-binding cassette subfamily B protein
LAVLVMGALEVIAGRLTTGDLFQFLIVMGLLVWPLLATGMILGMIHRAKAAAERIEKLFAAATEPLGGSTPDLRGELSVRELTFTYPGANRPALEAVGFDLPAGHKLGLVGPVGAGKSTLMHLLLRLYDPPRGTIFVDGHDVLDLDLRALRRLFAFAPQAPFLFSDTVEDNVGFGISERLATDAYQEQDQDVILAAVRGSALEQDIESLAQGLETVVGERGVTLSGGQKQRVSLARALAAGRRTLMLDDTLSAVDHHTEARILHNLRDSRGGETVVVASHRLSAVADADLILNLRAGRIIAQGSHATLMAEGGEYDRTFRAQQESRALGGE